MNFCFLKKYTFILIFFLSFNQIHTQPINDFYSKPLDKIEESFLNLSQPEKVNLSNAYLLKAKLGKDSIKIINGYYLKSITNSHTEIAVEYSDSIIQVAKNISDKYLLARAYLQKGIQLYYLAKYSESLNNYLNANKLFLALKNQYYTLKTKHYIGLLKNTYNQDKEALTIFRENMNFFNQKPDYQKKYSDQYYKSLFALADSYNRNQKLDSAEILNQKGIVETHQSNSSLYPHFLISYGENKIFKNESELAIDSLLKAIDFVQHKKKSLCGLYILISEAYEKVNALDSSILYLQKIDSVYQNHPSAIFHAKTSYRKLYNYYKSNNNAEQQLEAVNKLLVVDSIIKKDYSGLEQKINKEYDIPLLISEKEKLISKLREKDILNRKRILIAGVSGLLLVILLTHFISKNIRYKRRFNQLIKSVPNNEEIKNNHNLEQITRATNTIGLPEDIVENILLKLTNFENSSRFIGKKYTLNSLAKELKTNSTYLSSVINHSKNNNFSNYINNLRVDYAIHKLKSDDLFRSYTIKAIAEEVGFNTAQSFTNAFYKKTGLYPSYFIKHLNKT